MSANFFSEIFLLVLKRERCRLSNKILHVFIISFYVVLQTRFSVFLLNTLSWGQSAYAVCRFFTLPSKFVVVKLGWNSSFFVRFLPFSLIFIQNSLCSPNGGRSMQSRWLMYNVFPIYLTSWFYSNIFFPFCTLIFPHFTELMHLVVQTNRQTTYSLVLKVRFFFFGIIINEIIFSVPRPTFSSPKLRPVEKQERN